MLAAGPTAWSPTSRRRCRTVREHLPLPDHADRAHGSHHHFEACSCTRSMTSPTVTGRRSTASRSAPRRGALSSSVLRNPSRSSGGLPTTSCGRDELPTARSSACWPSSTARASRVSLKVAAMLDERGDGHVPPHSELERMLFAAFDAGGLPASDSPAAAARTRSGRGARRRRLCRRQDVARGRRTAVAPACRIGASRSRAGRAARRAGCVTLRVVHEQMRDDPVGVCAVVEETRAVRLRQLGAVA